MSMCRAAARHLIFSSCIGVQRMWICAVFWRVKNLPSLLRRLLCHSQPNFTSEHMFFFTCAMGVG